MTPLNVGLFAVGMLALAAIWVLIAYNSLVRARLKVGEALSGVDVQLRLRHDLVPALIEAVGAYARHEQSLLDRATQIRAEVERVQSAALSGMLENQLASTLTQVTALTEAYPQLAASTNFRELAEELSGIEDEIQAASAIYNSNVQIYNSLLESVPTMWVARAMRFSAASFVRLDVAEVHSRRLAAA